MKIYTIGFTKKSASSFFGALKDSGAKRLVDVRLNNKSQLAGFAKRDDLAYFLKELRGVDLEYVHVPDLAPTQELLSAYRNRKISWNTYERKFLELMEERRIEETVHSDVLEDGCLLCSEHEPDHCHRSLVVKYLQKRWGGIEVDHLGLDAIESKQRSASKQPRRASGRKATKRQVATARTRSAE